MMDEDDVLVVAAGTAWPFYQLTAAYVCQAGRSFRLTSWLAFYSKRTLHGVAARIEGVTDGIELTDAASARLSMSTDAHDRRIGNVMAAALMGAWKEGERSKIILLSGLESPDTQRFPSLTHDGDSAWTMGQRYTRLGALRAAGSSTAELTEANGRG